MEKVFFDFLRPIIIDNPILAAALFVIVSFLRWKVNEFFGWLKRVETETKRDMQELREQTRDGLREERNYRHDIITEMDKRIHELTKEVSELRAMVASKRR